jgi:hypothetical protein
MLGSRGVPMKQEPPVLVGGSAGRAFTGYQMGGFPPKGAPLTGCENYGPKNVTAARGFETVLVRLAVLRLPPQETVFRFSTEHADTAFAVLSRCDMLRMDCACKIRQSPTR